MQLVLRVLLWGPDARPVTALAAAAPPYMGDRAWLELGPGSMGAASPARWGRGSDPSTENRPGAAGTGAAGRCGWPGFGVVGVRGQGTGPVTLCHVNRVLGDGATVPEVMVSTSLFQDCPATWGWGRRNSRDAGPGHCPASWGPCPVRDAQADRCSWVHVLCVQAACPECGEPGETGAPLPGHRKPLVWPGSPVL